MADPADNAGASSENINNTQKLKDTFVEIKDTLKSISLILTIKLITGTQSLKK